MADLVGGRCVRSIYGKLILLLVGNHSIDDGTISHHHVVHKMLHLLGGMGGVLMVLMSTRLGVVEVGVGWR